VLEVPVVEARGDFAHAGHGSRDLGEDAAALHGVDAQHVLGDAQEAVPAAQRLRAVGLEHAKHELGRICSERAGDVFVPVAAHCLDAGEELGAVALDDEQVVGADAAVLVRGDRREDGLFLVAQAYGVHLVEDDEGVSVGGVLVELDSRHRRRFLP